MQDNLMASIVNIVLILMKLFSEGNGGINAVEIRTQTDNREVFAVRRVFSHPLRDNNQRRLTYYYDLAILELGKQAKTKGLKKPNEY